MLLRENEQCLARWTFWYLLRRASSLQNDCSQQFLDRLKIKARLHEFTSQSEVSFRLGAEPKILSMYSGA